MTLTVRPLHPNFLAEVSGLDMRDPPDAGLVRAIVEAAGAPRTGPANRSRET
jgi:hypothetical protein